MLHSIVRRGFPERLTIFALLALLGLWGSPRAWAIDISSCPIAIEDPGVYHVTQDLNCPGNGAAILVSSNNVTLSLDGHTITGPGSSHPSANAVVVAAHNCSISNGSIKDFGTAVALEGNSNSVSGLTITQCKTGVDLEGQNNTVSANSIMSGGTGIFVDGQTNGITGNTCSDNSIGIKVNGSGNSLTGNTAMGNSTVDLDDEDPTCDENGWSSNCFGTANHPCIGTSVCASQVSISCPSGKSVNATFANPTSAIVDTGAPSTTPAGLPIAGVRADGKALTDPFPLGATTITWMVNPGQENAQSCLQTITVNSPGVPTITCPGNQTVTAAAGQNSAIVAAGMATTDAVGATLVGVRSDGKALTDPFPVGTTTITWMVTFDEQAPVSCTQTFTVQAAVSSPAIIRGPNQADPHLDSILVNSGPVYQRAILHGRGFADVQGTSYVTLGGNQIPVLAWSNDAIDVLILPQAWKQAALAPNAAYPVQVVITANGKKSNTVDFFLTDGPPPN